MTIISNIGALAGAGKGATPSAPILSYTQEKTFTITNYDPNLNYLISGSTRSGNIITVTSTGVSATIVSKYQKSVISSQTVSMLTLNHSRVLYGSASGIGSAGCGPRPTICCPSGMITNTNGDTCIPGGGTRGCFYECCPYGNYTCSDCTGLFGSCYNWYWTDYSANNYSLYGSTWGKAE